MSVVVSSDGTFETRGAAHEGPHQIISAQGREAGPMACRGSHGELKKPCDEIEATQCLIPTRTGSGLDCRASERLAVHVAPDDRRDRDTPGVATAASASQRQEAVPEGRRAAGCIFGPRIHVLNIRNGIGHCAFSWHRSFLGQYPRRSGAYHVP